MEYLDMLAKIGAGTAHPGGFSATMEQLQAHPIPLHHHILEVGCGTGRTACYLASKGYKVTAMDIRPDMLQKAKKRAKAEGVEVEFIEGDASNMTFANNQFDTILSESVTLFSGIAATLKEYYRVLKDGGTLYDREMLAMKPIPDELKQTIQDFYKIEQLLDMPAWESRIQESGFRNYEIWNPQPLTLGSLNDNIRYPDLQQEADENAYDEKGLRDVVERYNEIMDKWLAYFGFGVVVGTK